METIIQSYNKIKDNINNKAQLIVVSKTFPAERLLPLINEGHKHFGENYVQEAVEKVKLLQGNELVWHFIGPLQSNKTKLVSENFAWVHTIDRFKIAERLNNQRPANLPPLNVCIQINIDDESSKSGVLPSEAEDLLKQLKTLQNVKMRGLMCIPEKNGSDAFKRMQVLFNALNAKGWQLDTLSMGMSNDYQEALKNGATMVRVGSAILGARKSL